LLRRKRHFFAMPRDERIKSLMRIGLLRSAAISFNRVGVAAARETNPRILFPCIGLRLENSFHRVE
jgi:hypothetical protein